MKNPQAFPGLYEGMGTGGWEGMSLRDYFAAKVLSGFCSGEMGDWLMNRGDPGNAFDRAAERAYMMADAMLKARG